MTSVARSCHHESINKARVRSEAELRSSTARSGSRDKIIFGWIGQKIMVMIRKTNRFWILAIVDFVELTWQGRIFIVEQEYLQTSCQSEGRKDPGRSSQV